MGSGRPGWLGAGYTSYTRKERGQIKIHRRGKTEGQPQLPLVFFMIVLARVRSLLTLPSSSKVSHLLHKAVLRQRQPAYFYPDFTNEGVEAWSSSPICPQARSRSRVTAGARAGLPVLCSREPSVDRLGERVAGESSESTQLIQNRPQNLSDSAGGSWTGK